MVRNTRAVKDESPISDDDRQQIEDAIDVWRWIAQSRSRFEATIARWEHTTKHGLPVPENARGTDDAESASSLERSQQIAQGALRALRSRFAEFERRVLPYASGSRPGLPFAVRKAYRVGALVGPPVLRDADDRDKALRLAYKAVVAVLKETRVTLGTLNGKPIIAGEEQKLMQAQGAMRLAWNYDLGLPPSDASNDILRERLEKLRTTFPHYADTELAIVAVSKTTGYEESMVRAAMDNRKAKKRERPKRSRRKARRTTK